MTKCPAVTFGKRDDNTEPTKEEVDKNGASKCPHIFRNKDEMDESLQHLCYGNLYVIGRLWLEGMKKMLVGADMCLVPKDLVPAVEAGDKCANARKVVKPPPIVEKVKSKCADKSYEKEKVDVTPAVVGPLLRLSDLSIYNYYGDAKDKELERAKCKCHQKRLLHCALLPYVSRARIKTQRFIGKVRNSLSQTWRDISKQIKSRKDNFVCYMRDPENLLVRRGTVVSSGIVGFFLGRRLSKYKDSLLAGLALGTVMVLGSGALCFPKETDENIRGASHMVGKATTAAYNWYCKKKLVVKDNICITSKEVAENQKLKSQIKDDCRKLDIEKQRKYEEILSKIEEHNRKVEEEKKKHR